MKENTEHKKHLLRKEFVDYQIKMLNEKPDFKLEYALNNAYSKGWREREALAKESEEKIGILTDIILQSMTPAYLESLQQTYINQRAYEKELSKLSLQMFELSKRKISKRKRISKAIQHRNKMTELHKAHLQHKVLNEPDRNDYHN